MPIKCTISTDADHTGNLGGDPQRKQGQRTWASRRLDMARCRRVCIYAKTEGTLIDWRDSVMIRLMSDCLLRISEIVAVNVWACPVHRVVQVSACLAYVEGTMQ